MLALWRSPGLAYLLFGERRPGCLRRDECLGRNLHTRSLVNRDVHICQGATLAIRSHSSVSPC